MRYQSVNQKIIDYISICIITIFGILSLYSYIGGFFLAIAIIHRIIWQNRQAVSVSEKIINILIFYLPFFTLFRLILKQIGLSSVSTILNYLRDTLILLSFVRVLLRKRTIKLRGSDTVWIIFVFTWVVSFFVGIIYGNYSIAIAGLHLSVIPMLLYITIISDNEVIDGNTVCDNLLKIALAIAAIGLYAYLTRPAYYTRLFSLAGNEIDARDYVRFVSVFFTPNVCGSFLSIGLSVSLAAFLMNRKWIYIASAVFLFICNLLTLSRGAWFFSITAILLCFVIIKPKYGVSFFVICSIGLVLLDSMNYDLSILGVNMGRIVRERFFTIFDRNSTSAYGRVDYWQEAFKALKLSPFGYGLGVSSTAQIGRNNLTNLLVIDGFYAKTIVEAGVLGIIYSIGLVSWSIGKTIKGIKNVKSKLTYAVLLITVGVLMQCIGSNTLDFVCIAPWFWIGLGLVNDSVCARYSIMNTI